MIINVTNIILIMMNTINIILCTIVILAILCFIYYQTRNQLTEQDIAQLTDMWIKEVTVNHNPEAIYAMFCEGGSLVGTVSQVKRKGNDIKKYFDYFAKLPGIKVLHKKYNITKVTNDVFINTAFITWKWNSINEPIVARMSFVYKNNCIFQLHSSKLPNINQKLLQISNLN